MDPIIRDGISSAKTAEECLKDMMKEKNCAVTAMEKTVEQFKEIDKRCEQYSSEREALETKVNGVQSETDEIKTKFAALLDQFQEYLAAIEYQQSQEQEDFQNK